MRILMVIDALGKGGKERRMLELIKELSTRHDCRICLVSLTDIVEYDLVYQLPIEFRIINRRSKKDWRVFAKLYRKIREFNPDIVHSWGSMASIFLLPGLWLTGKKWVNGIIADAPLHLGWMNRQLWRTRFTSLFADAVVSNSIAGIRSYRTSGRKSICIYNGIDMNRFDNLRNARELREEIFPDSDQVHFVAGMVAAFEERKDYDTLIGASVALLQNYPHLRFLLIGSGSDFERIRNLVPPVWRDKIIFLGKRSDVESLVNILDVGILLTNASVHGEGISNSILEYMALAKPVIATRGGGTDEVVSDGSTGFLIDPRNEEQLVARIRDFINDRDLLQHLGNQARQRVKDQFSLSSMTRQYMDLYQRIINGETPGS